MIGKSRGKVGEGISGAGKSWTGSLKIQNSKLKIKN